MKNSPYLFVSLLLIFVVSCQTGPQKQQEFISGITPDSFHIMAVNVMPGYDNITDISLLLLNVEVPYHSELINNIDNVEKYQNNDLLMAANIGIYIVDLAYAYSFNDVSSAVASYVAAMELVGGFQKVELFIRDFMSQYTVNEIELDTILIKLEQDLKPSAIELSGEEEIRLYSALLTGNFTEKIFLLYSTISKYLESAVQENEKIENLQKLVWIASGQKKTLGELNKIIDGYAIPEEYQLYHHELINLEKQMNEASFLRDTSIVRSVEVVYNPEFINLYNEIVKIRGYITEPEVNSE